MDVDENAVIALWTNTKIFSDGMLEFLQISWNYPHEVDPTGKYSNYNYSESVMVHKKCFNGVAKSIWDHWAFATALCKSA